MVSTIVGCALCGADTAGTLVCGKCMVELSHMLHHLAVRLPDLRQIAAKKASVMVRESSHGSRTVAPIPVNVGAWQLQQNLIEYAVTLGKALGLRFVRVNAESLLSVASRRSQRLMSRNDAVQIYKLAETAVHRLDKQFEPPAYRILIGQCDHCGNDIWSSEEDLAAGWQPCTCGHTVNIHQVQEQRMYRLALSGAQGTAAALSKLLKGCGVDIKRKTINEWRRRQVLKPIGHQDGTPVYLLWDVWAAANR
ncbi:hypothetical protein [Bifidobacterium crudilactis]|jgi:hypothetical protein|uniref:hypothetical protein n=1 Tax=Bifidobacterium crudilactis TaxID=327277 RepID=UPI0023543E42|nr:hypothetical protein [Bifidobacterium crudilactis]MCI1868498.1 hypothetical protein [Bifidobacterium crudilactis]